METDEARARALIATLARHDFAAAVATFDDTLRAAMPADKLAATWAQIETQVGAFHQVDSVAVKSARGVTVAEATTSFARTSLLVRVAFAADHRVTGLFVTPIAQAIDWQPPPYAVLDSFEERLVTVGASPGLPGTLTLPRHAQHVAAVVLVHGSGPNDRDETVGAVKPFKDLAWGLASRGIAVLRYDKRTLVDPTGVHTQHDEVEVAAHEAIALLAAQPEIDPTRVALLGHSQGGYLAPRIAKADPAIKRLVILAGPTRALQDSIVAQLTYLSTLQHDDSLLAAARQFKAAVEDPALAPGDAIATPFGGGTIEGAYFLEVRDYHPERVAAELAIPILVLQGERDYQVTLAEDFPAWQRGLAHANATFHTYPGLNHLFTHGAGPPSPAEYSLPGHVDAAVVSDLATWLTS